MSNMNLHQSQSHEVLRSWQSQRTDVNHNKDFVLPLFVGNDDNSIEAIESMPGVYRYGSNRAIEYLDPLVTTFGLRAILLFPVVTKSDQAKLEALDSDDDDDEDDDSTSSAAESNSSSSSRSPSSSSSTDDDDRTGSIMPERLMPDEDDETRSMVATNSQNPFLSQNEEEKDHLLVDDVGSNRRLDDEPVAAKVTTRLAGKKTQLKKSALIKEGANSFKAPKSTTSATNSSSSRDVRLIRGLALKDENNPVLRLIPRLRAKFPELLIICDVCLCTFTSTGHCCLFEEHMPLTTQTFAQKSLLARPTVGNTQATAPLPLPLPSIPIGPTGHYPISNKITCQYLALLALEYARRGCNVVAPSDMMDGRIQTIRDKLNENHLHHVSILSYSAKFASAFYGPFRQATMNAPEFGDRRAYQLPPGSRAMAMKAVQRDIQQGADFVMVKPAGPYLDIVRDLREAHPNVPIAVYQVSGEYSMLKIAANANILDLKLALNEMLTAYRRAGATIIISYFTPEILRGEL